ncbi:MAG TPA: LecA/PA-IL family lectin [Ktedonobacteraceae bacterium]|nr:LecA/PA-IL family lectin [Ktedonobacteraceae bacterium]
MKRLLRSKLALSLAAIIMLAAAVLIPFSASITRSYAAQTTPGQCPQGKVCRVTGASTRGTLLPKTNTKNLVVNASQDLPGLDTGIDLTVGTDITITASGQATFGIGSTQDCNTTEETQPDGQRILSDGTLCPGKIDPSAVLPSSPVGELLASFGSSGWFAVGSSDGFTSAASGRLFLLYNDISGQYGNNSGTYQVVVTTSTPSALTIQGLYTRDGNGNVQNTFAPGATIQYVVNVNNSSGNSLIITIHYQAFGPNQNYIYDQTFPNVTIPQGGSGWYVQGTVPTNAPAGTYTMQVSVVDQNNNNNQDMQTGGQFAVTTANSLWGVDSYSHLTKAFYNSVKATYGTPDFWGRYIGNNPGYPNDMDLTEAPFAHNHGFAILPIYFNYAPNAVNGYSTGQAYATAAIEDAQRRLKISQGVVIFNDIEESSGVNPDAQFIQGWYDQFNSKFSYTYNKKKYTYQAGYYKAGYYGNGTSTSRFASAYCSAVNTEANIGTNSFIWSSEPSGSRTSKTNAPPYGPYTPSCTNQTFAWQYAIEGNGGPPNVDTDEVLSNLPLWHP